MKYVVALTCTNVHFLQMICSFFITSPLISLPNVCGGGTFVSSTMAKEKNVMDHTPGEDGQYPPRYSSET